MKWVSLKYVNLSKDEYEEMNHQCEDKWRHLTGQHMTFFIIIRLYQRQTSNPFPFVLFIKYVNLSKVWGWALMMKWVPLKYVNLIKDVYEEMSHWCEDKWRHVTGQHMTFLL